MSKKDELKTYISNIQHFNVHDGNGFRTTVFFQGCGLRCKWCQNPELISLRPVRIYNANLCKKCGACLEVCSAKAIFLNCDEKLSYDENVCKCCMNCEKECYFGATSFSSHYMTVSEVLEECLKDEVFYQYHGGGVTLSGGEPFLHHKFIRALLIELKNKGINTTIETAGMVPWENIELCLPYIDTFFYDLKLIDKSKRKYWLGTDNDMMLENLRRLSEKNSNIVIRIPLISGVNDSEEEFSQMIQFVDTLGIVKFIHILPFHQMGMGKYEMLGLKYELEEIEVSNEKRIKWCADYAINSGYKVDIGGSGFIGEI